MTITEGAKPITRCALYTRVSSRNQVEKDYNSLETQREKLEAFCKSQDNHEVYRNYSDGGFSGDSLNRPGLTQMLSDIRSGKTDCVVVYKIDRLTRSTRDFHTLIDIFEQFNVRFVSITQGIDTSSASGRLLRNILVDFAQFEREMIADRTRDKMRQRAEKGLWNGGKPPFGYKRDNKKLVPDPQEADAVRFMYDYYSSDPSVTRLRAELRSRGINNRSGKKWLKTSLSNILRNPVYIGKTRSHGKIFEGQHEALVEEIVFERAQTLQPERTHAKSRIDRTYLLKGLLKCGVCGSLMSPHYTQKRRKDGSINRIPYYRCTRTMHHDKKECTIRSFNASSIEAMVVDNIYELSRNDTYLRRSVEELNNGINESVEPLELEIRSLEERIRELEREIDRYVQALGQGVLSVQRLEEAIAERESDIVLIKSRLNELRQELNRTTSDQFNADLVKKNLLDFKAAFDGLAPKERAETLQYILQSVVVYPEKIILEIFDLPEFKAGSKNRTTKLLC